MNAARRLASERGFTLTEMLIATGIMVAVTAAVFQVMNPSQGTAQAQPEVSDMQQRLRVGVDTLSQDIVMAGAGTYYGAAAGAFSNFFAPIMPYRLSDTGGDPAAGVFYRSDAISLVFVPPTSSQTTIRDDMPKTSSELKVEAQANCPPAKSERLCGFEAGMRAIIIDPDGSWDPITITKVQGAARKLQFNGTLSTSYPEGSIIAQVETSTYYLKTDTASKTYELRYSDGYQTDVPVVDNVVGLDFEYFGDPQPPMLLPGVCLTSGCPGPYTSYGPKPPALGVSGPYGWPKGENCTFAAQGTHVPRLSPLGAGLGQVKLTPAMLTDGPWCPHASIQDRFDADLLRIRRVRVRLRVQAAAEVLRGPSGVLFTRGGTSTSAERYVPDRQVTFDVTPRNMNLGR
jgi:prepilin-type N-terminal cleavage/methylation domain-containing protein